MICTECCALVSFDLQQAFNDPWESNMSSWEMHQEKAWESDPKKYALVSLVIGRFAIEAMAHLYPSMYRIDDQNNDPICIHLYCR